MQNDEVVPTGAHKEMSMKEASEFVDNLDTSIIQIDQSEPTYELDPEFPCACFNSGIEGTWGWKDGAWTCSSCGDTQ